MHNYGELFSLGNEKKTIVFEDISKLKNYFFTLPWLKYPVNHPA